jgi:PBP1b-binding outer membrane lipoprotein LpoB
MNRILFKPRTSALVCVLACILLAVGCKKPETSVATTPAIEVTAVKVEPRDVPDAANDRMAWEACPRAA